uniref:G_PROTEIN_RECEP_F1_2 domain-containing protein n=1 Tax=Strongyloides papillosus TaxID=174720 RepID=A0A0N5BKV9_STREA
MITIADIIQFSYFVPSIILLVIFVIRLTNEMLIKRNPIYNNNFFPLILFKSYSDIILMISMFFCSRAARMNIMGDFYRENDGLAIYYYIILQICHTNIYGISLLSSLNTFIALVYPLKYNIWFSKKKIVICLTITLLFGSVYGIAMTFLHPYYRYSKSIKGYIITLKSLYVTYCAIAYAIVINIPIIALSTIMNVTSAVKFVKYYKTRNIRNSQNIPMFVYTIINFLAYSIVVTYTFGKIINFVTVKSDLVESIAQEIAYWNVDLMTFGLFYTVVFSCSPLRDLLLFKSIKESSYNNASSNNNKNERLRTQQTKTPNII